MTALPSLPVTFTTPMDLHPEAPNEADAWGRAAQLLEGAAKQLHRAADIYEQLGLGRASVLRGRAHTTESDAAWCKGHADVLLYEQRKLAEARSPQAEPSTQGSESCDAGLQSGPCPATVGSAATPSVADPTDDRIPDWVQDFADECRAEPGVWFLADRCDSQEEADRLWRQCDAAGLRVRVEQVADTAWDVEATW